jgi:hypothetical protein
MAKYFRTDRRSTLTNNASVLPSGVLSVTNSDITAESAIQVSRHH